MHLSLFVFAVCCLALTTGDICTRPSTKPSIPSGLTPVLNIPTFSADVEIYKKDLAVIIAMKVYYDRISQTIHLSYWENLHKMDRYFYFKDDEILLFETELNQGRGECTVENSLHKSSLAFMVGGSYYDSTKKAYTIPPVLNFFHFAGKDVKGQEIYPEYGGKTTVRGKDAYQFNSCQAWQSVDEDIFNFKAQVTHYFTNYKDTSSWNFPSDNLIMPLSMHVKGKYPNGGDIDDTWNFFNIRAEIPPYSLETPPGVICSKRKIDKPFPNLPTFLKMTIEVINNMDKSYRTLNEIYDTDGEIGVMRTTKTESSLQEQERIVTIDYFPSGLSFQIDEATKHCSIKNITSRTLPFYTNDKGVADIFSPRKFFMATGTDIAYLGQRMVRGMFCDTWTGNTYNFNLGNVTVEWYFAVPGTKSWNSLAQEKNIQLPVKFRIWTQMDSPFNLAQTDPYMDFNVFHVDYTKILLNSFSIKPCLTNSPSNLFIVQFPNVANKAKIPNIQELGWKILEAISIVAKVHWIRVSDFKVFFKDDTLMATFDLLNAPPYAGDVAGHVNELPLRNATSNLITAIRSGKLTVQLTALNSTSMLSFSASTNVSVRPSWDTPGNSRGGGRQGPNGRSGGPGKGGMPKGGPGKGGMPKGGKGGMPKGGKGGMPKGGPGKGGMPKGGGMPSKGGMRGGRPNVKAPYHGNNNNSGYSGGAMAALGIVMLAVGLASGGGSSYFLIYKRGLFA